MMRWLTGAAAAAAMTLASPAAKAEVTLDVYYANPSFAQFFNPIADAFMKAHPEIKIKYRAPAPTYDEAHQAVLRAAVTNQLPDVDFAAFYVLEEEVNVLGKRGQIVDLSSFLKAEPADWIKANYAPAVLELGQVDGKQWGMAFNASLPIMYFNTDLVTKAGGDPAHMPGNWPDAIALGTKIKALGEDAAGLGYNIHAWPDDWLWRAMVMQEGGQILDGKKVAFGGESGLKVMEYLRRFVTDAGMPLLDWDQSRQQFIAGKMGLFFDTPARLRQVTDLIGDKFKLGTAVFPIDDKAKGKLPTGGNAAVMFTKDPAKQKAAWEFIKFTTGPEAQAIVVKTSGYMPLNLRAVGPEFLGPYYSDHPNFGTVFKEIDRAGPWPGYPGGNTVRIWRAQRDIINAAMRGDLSPRDALAKLVSESNALMK